MNRRKVYWLWDADAGRDAMPKLYSSRRLAEAAMARAYEVRQTDWPAAPKDGLSIVVITIRTKLG